jgi:hypothetical protein
VGSIRMDQTSLLASFLACFSAPLLLQVFSGFFLVSFFASCALVMR